MDSISKHSVKIQLGTLVTVSLFMIATTFAYAKREDEQSHRIAILEEFKNTGERYTKGDAQRLEDQISEKLVRIEAKIDKILIQ